jgi:hypothetical protein
VTFDSSSTATAFYDPANLTFAGMKTDVVQYQPTTLALYKVGTSSFYKWNSGNTATLADFTAASELEYDESVLKSTISTVIGTNEFEKAITSVDLSKANVYQMSNRLVLYSGNTLLFSDLFKFDYFPNFNYIVLTLDADDYIQKIAYFRGSHIIFTRKRIYRISGEFGGVDFKVVLINDSIGCISPKSVKSINNTLIFLSNDGLYTIKQNFYMEGLENVEKVKRHNRRRFQL